LRLAKKLFRNQGKKSIEQIHHEKMIKYVRNFAPRHVIYLSQRKSFSKKHKKKEKNQNGTMPKNKNYLFKCEKCGKGTNRYPTHIKNEGTKTELCYKCYKE
jgi:hypothetical protein